MSSSQYIYDANVRKSWFVAMLISYLGTEGVNSGISSHGVTVVLGGESSKDQGNGLDKESRSGTGV